MYLKNSEFVRGPLPKHTLDLIKAGAIAGLFAAKKVIVVVLNHRLKNIILVEKIALSHLHFAQHN